MIYTYAEALGQLPSWVSAVILGVISVGPVPFYTLTFLGIYLADQMSEKGKGNMRTDWIINFAISFVAGILSSIAVAA